MVSAAERADLEHLAELDARPTAPARVVRSSGQGLSAYAVLDAAKAFDWFGVAGWNEDQTRAGMALVFAAIATVQNLGPIAVRWVGARVGEWWRSRHPAG